MKYKYNIKNLDCANCAKTIENKLNEDKNIKKAIVNFNSSTVTVETDLKDAFTYIKKIVSEIEPDAILSEDKIKENKNIDIFAINAGSLGFLTEIKIDEFEPTFINYLKGIVRKESRQLLEIVIKGEKIDVLNEIVISKKMASSKILNIFMSTEKTKICNYKADGIIVATPTGSTAYSLSAGGPIVMPQIKAMVVTPLAPHNLATRPIIISGEEKLILTLNPEQKGCIIVDGEIERDLQDTENVLIYYSEKKINLILPEDRDYYGILRDKLKWGDNLC